jgi:thioredoxin 1
MLIVDKDNFEAEVTQSAMPVVVDLWGPQCGPCLALMPDVEKLAASMEGTVKFCKLNVAENRRMAIALKVMSVPAILFFKNGEEVARLIGDAVTLEAIRQQAEALAA